MLLFSIAQTLTRLPETAANIPAGLLFIVATIFYVTVEASWFALEAKTNATLRRLLGYCGFCVVRAGIERNRAAVQRERRRNLMHRFDALDA